MNHAFFAHFVGNYPGKDSYEIAHKLVGLGILTVGAAFGLNAGYDTYMHSMARGIVLQAIEDSKKPGSPRPEVLIALQIQVRDSKSVFPRTGRVLLDAMSSSSASVSIASIQAETSKAQLDSALLLEAMRSKQLRIEESQFVNCRVGASTSTEVMDSERQLSEETLDTALLHLRQFPLSKKDFSPAVWEFLREIYDDSYVARIESAVLATADSDEDTLALQETQTK